VRSIEKSVSRRRGRSSARQNGVGPRALNGYIFRGFFYSFAGDSRYEYACDLDGDGAINWRDNWLCWTQYGRAL